MLRHLQVISNKNIDAQYKAAVSIKRGMLVNKKHVDKTAILPITDEVYFVDRGLKVDPILSMIGTLSDYETALETIEKNEFVDLVPMERGERYGTDAYNSEKLTDYDADKYVKVDITASSPTQGKFIASETATKYKSCGLYNDNGHTLLKVEIVG